MQINFRNHGIKYRMENNRNHNRKTSDRAHNKSNRSNRERSRERQNRQGRATENHRPWGPAPRRRSGEASGASRSNTRSRTAANNRQKAAASARRQRGAERMALKLKKQSWKKIAIGIVILAVLGVITWQTVASIKLNMEIDKNIETVAKLEVKDPAEFLSAKTPGGINVSDFPAEENKIVHMDTSAVDNAELLRTFRGTVIIGDSLTKGCTNYGYLNDSIVIAQAAIPLRDSDHLFEKAIQSAPAAVFICLGANDIGYYGPNVDDFIAEYEKRILNLQKELPNTFIYVQGILPVADRITGSNQKYLSLYDEEMKKMCDDLGVYFFTSGFLLKQMPQLYDQDGIHPKKDFYPRWLTYIADIAGLKS